MPSRELQPPAKMAPNGIAHTSTLKKHKQLPHPRRNGSGDYSTPSSSITNSNPQSSTASASQSRGLSLETDVTSPSSINASPRTLKHASRRIIGSNDLPPTPPAHSRNSSNDASLPVAPVTNGDIVESPTCSTPVNVQSPPTPDFTPPRPRRVEGLKGLLVGLGKGIEGEKRREIGSRNDSMNTTTSFVTAREELEEENDRSTIRPNVNSPIDGTDYVPEYDGSNDMEPPPKMQSLGLGLPGLEEPLRRHRTLTEDGTQLRKKFSFEDGFDGDFSPQRNAEEAREVANPILSRNVTITRGKPRRKSYILDNKTPTKQPSMETREHRRRHSQPQHQQAEVMEDRLLGTPNAIRHLQKHGIEEGGSDFVRPTPRHSRQDEEMARGHRRSHTQPERLSPLPKARHDHAQHASQDLSQDARKFSNGSHRSNSKVEAVVMIQPQQMKMRRTLRHKERMGSLRDFSPGALPALRGVDGDTREPLPRLRHKSADLPTRNMEDRRVEERSMKREEPRIDERKRTASARPLPEKPRDVSEQDHAPARSRQVSEATIVPARSRQVSEQTVIEHPQEHPRRSPLPEPPKEEVVLMKPLLSSEPPQAVVKEQPVSRPPQAMETQAEFPKRRYSIERKPVPIRDARPRIDSTATTDTVATTQTTDSAKTRSRKALLADGIIPVVIVPRRTSSLKEQSQPPSLRSTSASRQQSKQGSRASSTAPLSASAGTNIPGAWPSWTETPLSIGKRRNSDGGSVVSVVSGKATTPKEDGLVRSIDFGPPAIPIRRSSMSAPTTPMGSRNVSRSNSLTADSLRRHNEDQALAALSSRAEKQRSNEPAQRTVSQTIQQRRDENRDSGVGYGVGIGAIGHSVRIEEPDISELEREHRHRSTHLSVDTNGDPLFGQRLSAQVTPFSARSDVTGASHGTALEVAEAREVGVFKHQNTSVQLVDQEPPSSSASESFKLRQKSNARSNGGRPTTSSSTATMVRPKLQAGEKYSSTSLASPKGAGGSGFNVPGSTNARWPSGTVNIVPASPPQTGNTIDSPLINPRQPPEVPAGPPAFKIIPPTPADLLAQEEASKQLGWEPPVDRDGEVSRPPRRNWSVKLSGLARTLSLGRRKSERGRPKFDDVDVGPSLSAPLDDEERPKEEGKLHPFWRPANYQDDRDDGCDCEECREYWQEQEELARQKKRDSAPVRPGMPRRTTSQVSAISKKMKRTFAILPLAGVQTSSSSIDDGYNVSYATARRTIKRSGSGNLKVVKRVGNVSKESLKLQEYLNMSSRRQRSFRRRLREGKSKDAVGSDDQPQTPPPQRKRFSWVGGSTDSPASKYPPAVRYPPQSSSATYESGPLKRTFSLPTRRVREATGTSFPPRVQVEWLGLGNLTRRFSGKGRRESTGSPEERREGLKRTISAPRGVRDGVDDVLTRRQRDEAQRNRGRMEHGVQTEDFAAREDYGYDRERE